MSSWWSKVKALLLKSELSTPTQPAVHEIIKRSQTFLIDYDVWKNGPKHKKMLSWIGDQYEDYRDPKRSHSSDIDFLHTNSTKGMAIHLADLKYNTEEARFLFDSFKEKIRQQDYRSQVSDTRTYSKNTWVETVERHYLKPRPQYDDAGKINQAFGNITLLLTFRNDEVYNLKVSATAYQDRLFNAEKQFSGLMNVITRKNSDV